MTCQLNPYLCKRDRMLEQSRVQVERLPLAYILLDADDCILEWNSVAKSIFGYTKDEVLGREGIDLIVPHLVSNYVREVLHRLRAGDMEALSINENRTKDGRFITCEWFNTPLIAADGSYAGVISLAKDITKEKQAEEQLKRSEMLLAEAERLAHLGSWELHIPSQSVTWSDELHRIFGLKAEEFDATYEAFLERVHPDDRAGVAAINARANQGHSPFEYVYRIVRPDGEIRTIHARERVEADCTGTAVHRLGACQDITEQRRSEERLRETEEKFRQLAENIDGYFWLNDPDDRKMHYMSPGYEKICGRSCESLYQFPESWTDLIHPEDRSRVLAAVRDPPSNVGRQIEYRIVRPDGSTRWIRDRAFPVRNASGAVYRVAGIGEDITESKRAEEAMREYTNRLHDLSRRIVEVQEEERRHLARELHDEIGQVLSTISVNLHASIEGGESDRRMRLDENIRVVNGAIQQVGKLLLDLRPSMLDDLGLVSTLRWYADRQAKTGGFIVNFVVESSGARLPSNMEIACYRVVQVALTNVVRHAQARQVRLEYRQQQEEVQLLIHDDGVGFNLDAVRRGAARGKSFGVLGMVERVELLGGQIEITSKPGHGTGIQVRFPLSSQPTPHAES